jgi:hypothetical protein
MSTIYHKGDYQKQRRKAYPPIEEQMDSIWKIFGHLRDAGVDLGPEAAMVDRVFHVKQSFPKT